MQSDQRMDGAIKSSITLLQGEGPSAPEGTSTREAIMWMRGRATRPVRAYCSNHIHPYPTMGEHPRTRSRMQSSLHPIWLG